MVVLALYCNWSDFKIFKQDSMCTGETLSQADKNTINFLLIYDQWWCHILLVLGLSSELLVLKKTETSILDATSCLVYKNY